RRLLENACAFPSCGVSSGSLFKVLREKLELKAPQERSDEEIEAKPVESAVWSGTKTSEY
ncbi:hypothetical protein, partial [Rummeliibacillus suwonensis]|uniref:hypothetical protein n=1 Tax=Rummeliibacillus suwonensis TaxID=1306154 RepID=UPI0028986F18